MKRRLVIGMLLSLLYCSEALAQTCSYCKGTGRVKQSVSVGTYGVSTTKKKCTECGEYYYLGSGHAHVTCKYCGGTGRRSSNSSRNSSDGSGSYNGPVVNYGDNIGSGVEVFHSGPYGIPCDDNEVQAYNEMKRKDPGNAAKFKEWRTTLNSSYSFYNQANRMGWHKGMNLSAVNNNYEQTVSRLNKLMEQMWLSEGLKTVTSKLGDLLYKEFNAYRSAIERQNKFDNMNDQLFRMQNYFY